MRSRGDCRLCRLIFGIVATVVIAAAIIFCLMLALDRAAWSRDLGQWTKTDPVIKEWFQSLMQPDTVGTLGGATSCCGDGDAYWADEVRVRDGKLFAVITDDRPDGDCAEHNSCRIHEEIGTEYEIPPGKIVGREQNLKGNPTGHVVIFLGTATWTKDAQGNDRRHRWVLCYVQNGGV